MVGKDQESLKIIQAVRSFGHHGGIENVAYELQRAWTELGLDCQILTTIQHEFAYKDHTRLVASWSSGIPTAGRIGYLGKLIAIPSFSFAATHSMRKPRQRRMVVSHGDLFEGDVAVIHAVNAASIAEKERAGKRLWRLNPMHAWVGWRDRYVIGGLRVRRYVAVSSRVAHELRDYYGVPDSRIATIPNGVNIDRFSPEAGNRAEVRKEFCIPQDAPLLMFAGHEFERKGLRYIIDALALLPLDVRLLVVGRDNPFSYKKQIVDLGIAPDRVLFTGHRSDLQRLYPAADVFVLPSYYEAYALVGMEAMSAGLPLCATKVGGVEEYLKDGSNGHFILRDGADIAARVASVLADPGRRRQMAAAARRTAESHSWLKIAERYIALFEELWAETELRSPLDDKFTQNGHRP